MRRTEPLKMAAALLAVCSGVAAAAPCRAVSAPYTVALVELYTSQGCSSCPPADQWLSRLPAGDPQFKAIPIALHIGYWDYIGWKDPFARKEFNNRQYELAGYNGKKGVYTPEVFVGAGEVADWDSPRSFTAALANVNARAPKAQIELQAQWVPSSADDRAARRLAVQARWSADRTSRDPQLLLAVKRSGYMTSVQAGENSGATLRNDHVVRAWAGPFKPGSQALTTELSVPAAAGQASLVAIAQDAVSGAVLQALELPLTACEPSSNK